MKHIALIAGWRKLFADETNGLRTSNEAFLSALLRYGSFEKLDIFLPQALISSFEVNWEHVLDKIGRKEAVQVESLWQVPFHLQQKPYEVMAVCDPIIERMGNLRHALATKPFAITGVTHSLHNFGDPARVLDLLLGRTAAFDSIICTSKAGLKVMEKSIEINTQRLQKRLNTPLSYSGRLDCIPLGVEPFDDLPVDNADLRKTLEIPDGGPLILCNGRINVFSKMDHVPLLIALREIIKIPGLEDTKLLIAGAVEMSNAYLGTLTLRATQLGVDKHVFFKLNYENWVKPYLYKAADVVVSIPDNTQETFGIAPVEAMLCGKPVVLSEWDGYKELIQDGVHGYHIPTYWSKSDPVVDFVFPYAYDQGLFYMAQSVAVDVPILIDRLQRLLLDPALRDKLGTAAKAHAQTQFTWKNVIARYEALWAELAQQAQIATWAGPTLHLDTPCVYDVFSHYASHILNPEDVVVRTDYGAKIERHEESINLYPTVLTWIDGPVLFKLLSITQIPLTLGEIHKKIGQSNPAVTYLILWAAKNNLLRITPASAL